MLTSVMKHMGEAVEAVVKPDKDGKFDQRAVRRHPGERRRRSWRRSTTSTSKVPAELKAELDQIKADIVDGKHQGRVRSQPEGLTASAKRHGPSGHRPHGPWRVSCAARSRLRRRH